MRPTSQPATIMPAISPPQLLQPRRPAAGPSSGAAPPQLRPPPTTTVPPPTLLKPRPSVTPKPPALQPSQPQSGPAQTRVTMPVVMPKPELKPSTPALQPSQPQSGPAQSRVTMPVVMPKPELKPSTPASRPPALGDRIDGTRQFQPQRGGLQSTAITAPPEGRGAGTTLNRPDPHKPRVTELLRPTQTEQIPDDLLVNDDKSKKPFKKGRKEKVTAEMKRAARKLREKARDEKAAAARKEKEEIFEVGEEGMSLEQLADIIQVDPSEIVRSLFMKGITLSMNQVLDKNICKVVAAEYDILVLDKAEETVAEKGKKRTEFLTDEDIDDLTPRPPVVTVMGHVDHGKTSLLDYIRKKRVAAGEAGGITQSIGAYNTSVEVDGELKTICFLDTPGHEAFSAMRARGAQVTDLAIIIVAADDGVRPQTREAVAHAQAAGVPILVAINKVDKAGADVERVKQELLELNLVAEEWGGSTPMVAVSAKKGTGIPDLLQAVTWMAEEQSLQANAKRAAQGTIIESHLDRKVGPVATLLVQAGTLKVGDIISAGAAYGKVRTLRDDLGQPMQEAGPSIAVQMVGLGSCPMAGEEWGVVASESAAREISVKSLASSRNQRMVEMTGGGSMVTLSSLATVDEDLEALQKMNLIIKGDTMGVVEAIKNALSALPQHSVTLRFLLSNAGDISISDVDLAAASTGLVLGFNLKPDTAVEEHAKRLGVKLMTYNVIYDLIDDVKAAMEGKLRSIDEKVFLGKGEVKAVFGTGMATGKELAGGHQQADRQQQSLSKRHTSIDCKSPSAACAGVCAGKKRVAGCVVLNGKLQKGAFVIVKRGKQVVAEGKLISLRRVKDNVDEVPEGVECGVGMEGFIEWQEKDTFECFQIVTKVRRLEEARAATAVDIPV
ncbi:hypothetical protein QJQ45_019178 [Haematococcus lacustris]|nr:hypothetical protein QJQ45_019178 [Haematococcus lacustris]